MAPDVVRKGLRNFLSHTASLVWPAEKDFARGCELLEFTTSIMLG
jgi:hypothetical protein